MATNAPSRLTREGWVVILGAAGLFGLWLALNFTRLFADPNGMLRFLLGLGFAVLLLFRPKPAGELSPVAFPRWVGLGLAGAGTLLISLGLIFTIHQFEWLGLLLLLTGTLVWALPGRTHRDLFWAAVILYWMHPLPGVVFGPMELGMQRASVIGAEWVLHGVGVAAWGDGLGLRSGLRLFEVPAACSGMKAAITVLFCGLGLTLLRRMNVWETLGATVLGLLQVLLLNILRIALLVAFGNDKPADWSPQIMHDTSGIFLLVAVGLVAVEAALWQAWRRGIRRRAELMDAGDFIGEPEDKLHRFPPFWQRLIRHTVMVTLVILGVALIGGGLWRMRPHYRADKILQVAEQVALTDPNTAMRAVQAGLEIDPGNRDLRMARIRLLFVRRQYAELLDELRRLSPAERTLDHLVMEARARLAQGDTEGAVKILDDLPAETQSWPAVAMIRAEFAALKNKPAEVNRHLKIAARWSRLADRIRALFPYLAAHEQWAVISDADPEVPYQRPQQAFLALTAHLRMNRMDRAAGVMNRVLSVWPGDFRFLDPLLALAIVRPQSEWEKKFEFALKANLGQLSNEDLARYAESCFLAYRPDWAWLAYRQLAARDPRDPALTFIPARNAQNWFTFRRHAWGLPDAQADTTVDLRPWVRLTRRISPWQTLWDMVPMVDELLKPDLESVQRQLAEQSLQELQRRERIGPLDRRFQRMMPRVLGQLGRPTEALAWYDRLIASFPADRHDLEMERASLLARVGNWPAAYERMRQMMVDSVDEESLVGRIQWANILMRLDMGALALPILHEARSRYPESNSARMALADVWSSQGFPEESLWTLGLNPLPSDVSAEMLADLLYRSGRIVTARKLVVGGDPERYPDHSQPLISLPAEAAMSWMGEPLGDADFEREASAKPIPTIESPFLSSWVKLRREWFRDRGRGATAKVDRWAALGRDEAEQAFALYTLAILSARKGDLALARDAAHRAVEKYPTSPIFQRVWVALAEDKRAVVQSAFTECPLDPEIWLAHLVVETKAGRDETWGRAEMESALTTKRYSPATLVRGGDFFLRRGWPGVAGRAAEGAIQNGNGHLPAYTLGIRCALSQTNLSWALTCAQEAANLSVEPWVFQKIIVDLKSRTHQMDSDLVQALEALFARYPKDRQWAGRLGDVYFQRGELGKALGLLTPILKNSQAGDNIQVRTWLLAAEAARSEGKLSNAMALLERARMLYPRDPAILNNLVYYLAQSPQTLARAEDLAEDLAKETESFEQLDTLAMVHLRSGRIAQATEAMRRALQLVQRGDYAWHEMYLNAAEIEWTAGRAREARRLVETVRADPRRSSADETRARDLLDKMRH
jgi:exosortase/archaeosortase family protein